jgi:hypothetical protein
MTNLIHVIPNFIDQEDANLWMQEATNPSKREDYPDYYSDRFGGTALPYNENTRYLNKKYGRKAAEYVRELYEFKSPVYVYKVFMNHTTNIGYSGGVHTDSVDPEPWIEWSAVLYLDDKFTGANLHFPNQQYIHKPTPLEAVIFPSSGTSHMHGISEMKSGERYSIVICLTSQPWKADPDMLEPHDNMEYVAGSWDMKEEEMKNGMA